MADTQRESSKRLVGYGALLALVLTAFFAVKTVNEIKRFNYIGEDSVESMSSVTVSGEGEVFATADIASFSYSVIEQGDTAAAAEAKATAKWNEILAYLKEQGIKDTDIKTTNYAINPVYQVPPANTVYVPMNERRVVGYTVTQTALVKVRDTAKVGEILSQVGALEVRNLSGISFTIDDEHALEEQARVAAIADAKAKAETLAKNLGVKLVGVANYYESNYTPYYDYGMRSMSMDSMAQAEMATPEIPMGENRIQVNVEITYRIR